MNRWQPSPSLVVSFVALFVALSGTALALKANSVGSKHIRDGAVKRAHVRDGAIDSSKVLDESLGAADIGADAVGGSEIATDAVGSGEIAPGAIGSSKIQTGAVGSPEIATNAVGSSEIADDAVGRFEIAPSAVGSDEIADGAVRAAAIGAGIVLRKGQGAVSLENVEHNGAYEMVKASTSCAPGEVILFGYGNWEKDFADVDPTVTNEELLNSKIELDTTNQSVTAWGGNDTNTSYIFRAVAVCLAG